MSPEDIEKSVDKTKCVQVLRTERKKGGGTRDVLRWIRPNNVEDNHNVVGNHHLLPKDHPQYQEESEATKPKEPKRKTKPKTETTKPTPPPKDETPKTKPKRKRRSPLGSHPLDNPEPKPFSSVIDAANKVHKELMEQKKMETSEKQSSNSSINSENASKQQKPAPKHEPQKTTPKEETPKKPTRADRLRPLKSGESIPEFITKEFGAIPPNYTDVMVADDPSEKVWLLATDSKGRIQAKYQPAFQHQKQDEKWGRCEAWTSEKSYKQLMKSLQQLAFAPVKLRTQQPKQVELSECLQLMLHTGIRPGSKVDTKASVKAYGATTLQARHVIKKGTDVFLNFTGKNGIQHNVKVTDPKIKKILLKRKSNAEWKGGPDSPLFSITDGDLRKVLEPSGLKPKDLRTIFAMYQAKKQLNSVTPTNDPQAFDSVVKHVCDNVCSLLGNKREETFDSYIAPSVWQEWSPDGFDQWNKT